jgi:hypothetical protein
MVERKVSNMFQILYLIFFSNIQSVLTVLMHILRSEDDFCVFLESSLMMMMMMMMINKQIKVYRRCGVKAPQSLKFG